MTAPAEVRATCAWVSSRAQHVSINNDALATFARTLAAQTLEPPPWDAHGWHYCSDASTGGGPLTAQYCLVLDALNWCFWPSAGAALEYDALAVGLRRVLEAEPEAFSAPRLAAATAVDVERWVPGLPDTEGRAAAVREVGAVLTSRFGGSALELVAAARGSAAALVGLVAEAFPRFRDEAVYVDAASGAARRVAFYKRAQIFVGDVWAAHGRRTCAAASQPCAFHDIHALTCFADYRIPQLLRARGVLVYAAPLAAAVDAREELPPGGALEVEVRAATVTAVERLCAAVTADRAGATPISSVELDWLLWNAGEVAHGLGELGHHHRCRTIFY